MGIAPKYHVKQHRLKEKKLYNQAFAANRFWFCPEFLSLTFSNRLGTGTNRQAPGNKAIGKMRFAGIHRSHVLLLMETIIYHINISYKLYETVSNMGHCQKKM